MAAFHFGDATKDEWNSWSLEQKISWYYDKTHSLISGAKNMFSGYLQLETENLSTEASRKALSDALSIPYIATSAHVNRHFPMAGLNEEERQWLHIYLSYLDLDRFGRDDAYGLDHFLTTFGRKMRAMQPHQNSRAITTARDVASLLERHLRDLEAMINTNAS